MLGIDESAWKASWEVGPDYLINKVLGQGGWGDVCEAIHIPTGKKVAIKRVKDVFKNKLKATRMLREITLLRKLNLHSDMFVRILDLVETKHQKRFGGFKDLYIVLELVDGDLRKLIKSEIYFTLEQVRQLTYDLLCGIKYMHSAAVLHRDLKPGNILLNNDGKIKICDFGLARSVAGLADTQKIIQERKQERKRKLIDDEDHHMHIEEHHDGKDHEGLGMESDHPTLDISSMEQQVIMSQLETERFYSQMTQDEPMRKEAGVSKGGGFSLDVKKALEGESPNPVTIDFQQISLKLQ
jgi:serine/threonine protein kinase